MNFYKNFSVFVLILNLCTFLNIFAPIGKVPNSPSSHSKVIDRVDTQIINAQQSNKGSIESSSFLSVKDRVKTLEEAGISSSGSQIPQKSQSNIDVLIPADKVSDIQKSINIPLQSAVAFKDTTGKSVDAVSLPYKPSLFQRIKKAIVAIKPKNQNQKNFETKIKQENIQLWKEKDREVNSIFDLMRSSVEDINKYIINVTYSKNASRKREELNDDISKLENILKDYPDKIGYKKELTILDKKNLLKQLESFKENVNAYPIALKFLNSSKKQSIAEKILPKKILEKSEDLKNNIWFSSLRVEKQFDEIQKNIQQLEKEISINKRTSLIKNILEKYEKFNQKRPEKTNKIDSGQLEFLNLNINLMKVEIIPKNNLKEREDAISLLEKNYTDVEKSIKKSSSPEIQDKLSSKLADVHRGLMAEKELYKKDKYEFELKSINKKEVGFLEVPFYIDEVFTKNLKELEPLNSDQIKTLNDLLTNLNQIKLSYIAHKELFLLFKREDLIKRIQDALNKNP